MSIESTFTIKRTDAIRMLEYKNILVYPNDCDERLADLLYENRESDFENYQVVPDFTFIEDEERIKEYW